MSDVAGIAATLIVLLAIWWPIRLAIAHRTEDRFKGAHPRNHEGFIVGAEPIHVRGVRPGAVLVLHGYNDSPQAVSSLAGALHEAGWTVRAPALPGHARTLPEFARSGADQWVRAARDEFRSLRAEHAGVAVCGMSMGGALAMIVAAEEPDVQAIVGIAPYVAVPRRLRALLLLSPIATLGARYLAGRGDSSVHDPDAASGIIAYRLSTARLIRELVGVADSGAAALARVTQPVLVFQSREDNRIAAAAAQRAFDRIGSRDKSLRWISGAGHVLTVDYGHETLEAETVAWLNARLP